MFYLDVLQRLGGYSEIVTDLTGRQGRRQEVFAVDGTGMLTQHLSQQEASARHKADTFKNKNLRIIVKYKITLKKTKKINN